MGRMVEHAKSEYHWRLPWWMKEGLRWLAGRKGRDANELIEEAMLRQHPELLQFKPQDKHKVA